MLKSYLAIASTRGLVAFAPEQGRTLDLFLDGARRLNSDRAGCWWAVLPEDEAAEVTRRMECGEPASALYALNQRAALAGRILPSDRAGTY